MFTRELESAITEVLQPLAELMRHNLAVCPDLDATLARSVRIDDHWYKMTLTAAPSHVGGCGTSKVIFDLWWTLANDRAPFLKEEWAQSSLAVALAEMMTHSGHVPTAKVEDGVISCHVAVAA